MGVKFNPFTGNLDLIDTTAAAGADTQVQYNNGGSLAGSADLTWDDTTGYLRLGSGTGGIQFNGDTAAANALDDYEEGTWTPVVADAASGGNTGTFAENNSWYRKIGNTVFVFTELYDVDTTGLTAGNTFWVRNLPFNIPSGKAFAGWGQSAPLASQTSLGIPFANATASPTGYRISYCTSSGAKAAFVSDVTSGATDIFFGLAYYV